MAGSAVPTATPTSVVVTDAPSLEPTALPTASVEQPQDAQGPAEQATSVRSFDVN